MFFKSKKVIGLDIGSTSIKIAELDVSRSGAILQNFSIAPTPPNSVSSGELTDIPNIAGTIRGMLDQMKTKRAKVCTGMWGMSVIVKKITIPRMDKKMLGEQIRFEAEQYIPFDINNVALAHHVLPTSSSPDTMDILLIAAQNELVGQYYQTLELAGLTPEIIDVSGFALANCFEQNYGQFPGDNIGLLNFGATITNFVVISNGSVIFSRDIPIGGFNYTAEISKALGISYAEAEGLKMSAVSGQEVPDEVPSILSSTNEVVAEEVRTSLEFLSAATNGLGLNRCLISGGASGTPGLADAIVRVAGFQVEYFNPFLRLKLNTKKITPDYANQIGPFAGVVLGLALREAGDA